MSFEVAQYGYGDIEQALGRAFFAGETAQGALRARLKRLQALGIPAPKPEETREEKTRRKYSLAESHQWLVALMLQDLGLPPEFVAQAVRKAWPRNLAPNAAKATAPETLGDNVIGKAGVVVQGNPIVLDARFSTISGPWRTGDPDTTLKYVRLIPRFNKTTLAQLRKRWPQLKKQGWTEADLLREADEVRNGFDSLQEEDGWFVARNYSQKAHTLESVLNGGEE